MNINVQSVDKSRREIKTASQRGFPPSLYVLNAASLAKPHAKEQLIVDLHGYNVDIAIITETHFKNKHTKSITEIPKYNLVRRDRPKRRGGGVALYISSSLKFEIINTKDAEYEIIWIAIFSQRDTYIFGAIYHPPKCNYNEADLLLYLENCLITLNSKFSNCTVILGGDFNMLSHEKIVEHTAMLCLLYTSPSPRD